ncbi:MAG: methylated-DNA--[protein]-cysteine S-methyltransferase [Legionellaceae bacterium]|nr:methylated-DNA--[protein]-cysteine S-methyltransferase [Legionellaceae bacterium]
MTIKTPAGSMIAISDDSALYLLEFIDRKNLDKNIQKLRHETGRVRLDEGLTKPLLSIQGELTAYFENQLEKFQTPLQLSGTLFQKKVWQTLQKIPYGETRSYAEQAHMLQRPKATRAVANANASNQFALIIPCHRVIRTDKTLGGYAAGIERKKWLLEHEAMKNIIIQEINPL